MIKTVKEGKTGASLSRLRQPRQERDGKVLSFRPVARELSGEEVLSIIQKKASELKAEVAKEIRQTLERVKSKR